ncbi:hypothetical protein FGE05_13730 [Pseudomonas sp. ICMP22404]|nr:hypothetical protein FGE05_13730 [Pseudomonas sp. ICMP22404]
MTPSILAYKFILMLFEIIYFEVTVCSQRGSGLARESGLSVTSDVECVDAFAGKPGFHRVKRFGGSGTACAVRWANRMTARAPSENR